MDRMILDCFERCIMVFYRKKGRKHLPWRKKGITPYEVWVSEIMLQQTQVDRVIDFYVKFLKRFPTIRELSRVSWEKFLPYYQGLGYYNRGRNMLSSAQIICKRYEGKFPEDIEILETLPGIGKYTARAVMSFSKNFDFLAWDINFQRVFGRFFFGSKDTAIDPLEFEGKIVAKKRDFNGAIMDFGSLVCVREPRCNICILQCHCVYFQEKGKGEILKKRENKVFCQKEATVWVFLHKDHKIYYSDNKKIYAPFQVPKRDNTREGIKKYFLKKYGLIVSVRPPHKKDLIQGNPTLFVNAQILLGNYTFSIFEKEEVRKFLKKTFGEGDKIVNSPDKLNTRKVIENKIRSRKGTRKKPKLS